MMAMRERAAHRGRPRRRKGPAAQTPLDDAPREDALPLEDIAYDPESMPPPPAARGTHPADDAVAVDDSVLDDHRLDDSVLDVHRLDDSLLGDDVLPAAEDDGREPAAQQQKPRPAKKNSRPSVPSWDDVMFGARPRD
jgi:hypothetical protein